MESERGRLQYKAITSIIRDMQLRRRQGGEIYDKICNEGYHRIWVFVLDVDSRDTSILCRQAV